MSTALTESGGRQRLTIERRFEHPVARVWRSVIEPEHLSAWYPATVTALDPRLGGTVAFDYGSDITTTATIVDYEPLQVFAFLEKSPVEMARESDSLTRIELFGEGDGCIMRFTHEFDDRPAAASYATGWNGCLDMLANVLDGNAPVAHVTDVALYERLISEFALDEPVVVGEGIRVERQLMMQPKSAVWALLQPDSAGSLSPLIPRDAGDGVIAQLVDDESIDVAMTDGSRIRWSLDDGPGGARILITHDGLHSRDAAAIDTLRLAWKGHVERLVLQLSR